MDSQGKRYLLAKIKEAEETLKKLREEELQKRVLLSMHSSFDETGACRLPDDITDIELNIIGEWADKQIEKATRRLEELEKKQDTEVRARVDDEKALDDEKTPTK